MFVASIHFALSYTFGFENVMVEQCEHMASDHDMTRGVVVHHVLEIVVLDAVLAQSKTHTLPLSSIGANVDKPIKMHIADDYLKDTKYDHCFRAMVVVLPEAGVYYCHQERRKACVGVLNSLVPMDINWLRLLRNATPEKRFSNNGYITRLWGGSPDCMWKWRISGGSTAFNIPAAASLPLTIRSLEGSQQKTVYYLRQCADEDSPRLPPDFVWGNDLSSTDTLKECQQLYLMRYVRSPLAKSGCRHFVKHFLHRNINPEKVWIIDAALEGNVDLHVSTHIRHPQEKDKVSLFRDSIVQIKHFPALGKEAMLLLGDIRDHASNVRVKRGSSSRCAEKPW